jgi:hypothetical protein
VSKDAKLQPSKIKQEF